MKALVGMARCMKCGKFTLFRTAEGYCKDCKKSFPVSNDSEKHINSVDAIAISVNSEPYEDESLKKLKSYLD